MTGAVADPVDERVGEPTEVQPSQVFSINIRVNVYPQGDRWYAASVDYLVVGEGRTPSEAVAEFVGAANAYLATALAHGWLDAMNRRPALARRWEIRRRVFLARLLRRKPTIVRKHLEYGPRSFRLA